jgi:adenylate kinase
MKDKNTFAIILIGRSGSGKGTQGEFIKKYFSEKFKDLQMHEVGTGKKFREFQAGESYSAELSRQINAEGKLQPEFLAAWNWGSTLVELIDKPCNVMFDGVPRRYDEARVLDSAIKFYGFTKRLVIDIHVSEDEALKRMLARKREDDTEENIKKRLKWYERDVLPVLDWYSTHRGYDILHIDGMRSVDDIWENIKTYLDKWTS